MQGIVCYCSSGNEDSNKYARYGNGNPFAFLLANTPALYYIVLTAVSISGMALIISITILVQKWLSCKNTVQSVTEVE